MLIRLLYETSMDQSSKWVPDFFGHDTARVDSTRRGPVAECADGSITPPGRDGGGLKVMRIVLCG